MASGKKIGKKNNQRQLGEFGGLKLNRAEYQPTARLADSWSEKEGGYQQKHGENIDAEDYPAVIKKWPPINKSHKLHHPEGDHEPDQLLNKKRPADAGQDKKTAERQKK